MNDMNNSPSDQRSETISTLQERLFRIAQIDGDYETAIPALSIHRRSSVTAPLHCIYPLGLAITVSGHKQVTSGKEVFQYGAGQALLVSVDLPVVSCVTQASQAEPFLGLMLRLDPRLVMKVAAGLTLPQTPRGNHYKALSRGTLDTALLDAVQRLLALLDEPALLATVVPLIQQEIIARVLLSEQGAQFMLLHASGSPSRPITQSMAWLKQHFTESISIESLAKQAHMSPSTFRQHFKAVAGISPLQYLKQLRLQEARQLMLNQGLDAGASGLRVGYESVTQFSREYARLFGEPPLRDIKQLRAQENRDASH